MAMSRENLSLGVCDQVKDSNRPAQVQRLSKSLEILNLASESSVLSRQRTDPADAQDDPSLCLAHVFL